MRGMRQLENWTPAREIDGRWVGEASFEIPADLPLGYHTSGLAAAAQEAAMPLIITPAWVGSRSASGGAAGLGAGHPALQRPVARLLGCR